jgi:hypothetical protein
MQMVMDESKSAQSTPRPGDECRWAAREYLRLGWSPSVCCPPDHAGVSEKHAETCDSPGKAPWHKWKHLQETRLTASEIDNLFQKNPRSNVGIFLGPVSCLVRIDVDGPGGERRLQELSGGDLPPTLEFTSGREDSGRGLLYKIPEGAILRTTTEKPKPGEEIRFQAKGAQTVLPPSRHSSGTHYSWKAGHGPKEIEAALMPDWLVRQLSEKPKPKHTTNGHVTADDRDLALSALGGLSLRRVDNYDDWLHVGMVLHSVDQSASMLGEWEKWSAQCPDKYKDSECKHKWSTFTANGGKGLGSLIRWAEADGWRRPQPKITFGKKKLTAQDAREPCDRASERQLSVGLATTCLDTIQPVPLRWLVPGYIPLGKLVMLAGDGGHGKSTWTLTMTADLTTGRPCLGLKYAAEEPVEVLLVSCEDDFADTVVPRLMAAGADLSKIHRVDGIRTKDGKLAQFSLQHYEAISEELAARPNVRAVFIDPAGAYVGRAGVDDHKDSELRALLGPLSDLAAKHRVTITLVKHLVKGATARAVHKVSGSAGYVNAVRAAFVLAPSPEDEALKLLLPLKFNIGRKPAGLSFRLVGLEPEEQIDLLQSLDHLNADDKRALGEQLFRIQWAGAVAIGADEALAEAARKERGGTKVDEAAEWVEQFLATYAYPSDEIVEAGKQAGFSFDAVVKGKGKLKNDGKLWNSKDGNGGWWSGLGKPETWTRRPSKKGAA